MFRLQKYKKFESNSQHSSTEYESLLSCFDCKSTKNLRAIHNWLLKTARCVTLFRLQKYKKFESNSQPCCFPWDYRACCFDCKSTKNLRAIHNAAILLPHPRTVVSTAKVQKIWEQFTTMAMNSYIPSELFRLQKYKKFESNSQLRLLLSNWYLGCFDCKSTKNLRAIHNE